MLIKYLSLTTGCSACLRCRTALIATAERRPDLPTSIRCDVGAASRQLSRSQWCRDCRSEAPCLRHIQDIEQGQSVIGVDQSRSPVLVFVRVGWNIVAGCCGRRRGGSASVYSWSRLESRR